MRRILDESALVIPESWGIHWASRKLGAPLAEFIPGIDMMLEICRLAADEGHSIYLLGSAPGVSQAAAEALQKRYPKLIVAGAGQGYFKSPEEASVIAKIRQKKPALLFVGMGMPAQEKWIARNLAALGVPVVMGVGGSFDVLSGRLKRAPTWMRRLGIEWSYRLMKEPWRWKEAGLTVLVLQPPTVAMEVYSTAMFRHLLSRDGRELRVVA